MTKEQEAIEKLTNGEKIDFNTLIRKFKKEGIENFVVTKKEYIETVLSMLKQKDKEIEKKDKIIDLMAEFLGEKDMGYYKKEEGGEFLGIMRRYSKEDWKQYFESKVKK